MGNSRQDDYEYDVCLSFAGEDRAFVREVADTLRASGIRVFYDEYSEVDLWGKDLYEHLNDVYKNAARYCVMFISENYAEKLWTTHERRSAQERAFKDNQEYILPARFDHTPVPGLRDTVGYIDLRSHTAESFSELVRKKVGGHVRASYLPPIPDRLYELLGATAENEEEIYDSAYSFLATLKRMSLEERRLLFHFVRNACPAELPENVHINLDLLRRITGFTPGKIKRLLGGLRSLGFSASVREDDETDPAELGSTEMLVLTWDDLSLSGFEHGTALANAMIEGATENYCEEHGLEALGRLDFSQLARATAVVDKHE